MQNRVLVLPLLLAIIGVTIATNYCDRSLCGNDPHIACNHNGHFERRCSNDAQIVEMTKDLRNYLTDQHNLRRNTIAGGGDPRYNRACAMATMRWSDELAWLAELNVKQCIMKHDKCHNTYDFPISGQNLAWHTYRGRPDSYWQIDFAMNFWYREKDNMGMDYIRKFPSYHRGPQIGHFTVMMLENNTHLGCAASTYYSEDENSYVYLIACNYAQQNIYEEPIYRTCSNAGSDCQRGRNNNYKSLCSLNEPYYHY